MPCLVFTSRLDLQYRDALEQLLFFNAQQARSSRAVADIVRRYGIPRLRVVDDQLRIELDDHPTQTLFAILDDDTSERPVGVTVYTREDDTLVVLLFAIDPTCSLRGSHRDLGTALRMLGEIRRIATQVRGISNLRLHLGRGAPTRIQLSAPPDPGDDAP